MVNPDVLRLARKDLDRQTRLLTTLAFEQAQERDKTAILQAVTLLQQADQQLNAVRDRHLEAR